MVIPCSLLTPLQDDLRLLTATVLSQMEVRLGVGGWAAPLHARTGPQLAQCQQGS